MFGVSGVDDDHDDGGSYACNGRLGSGASAFLFLVTIMDLHAFVGVVIGLFAWLLYQCFFDPDPDTRRRARQCVHACVHFF